MRESMLLGYAEKCRCALCFAVCLFWLCVSLSNYRFLRQQFSKKRLEECCALMRCHVFKRKCAIEMSEMI